MDLIFQETQNRQQCNCEFLVNNTVTQCTFSTSISVNIPRGFVFFDGKLEKNDSVTNTTLSICQNHKTRLKNALKDLMGS